MLRKEKSSRKRKNHQKIRTSKEPLALLIYSKFETPIAYHTRRKATLVSDSSDSASTTFAGKAIDGSIFRKLLKVDSGMLNMSVYDYSIRRGTSFPFWGSNHDGPFSQLLIPGHISNSTTSYYTTMPLFRFWNHKDFRLNRLKYK